MCENVIIDGIQVRNPSFAQNGDGIDLESCRNSLIVNSTFDVGDDAICVKSGKDEDGRRRNMPTENLIVDNCTVFKGHGGFVVGSEMSGGVKNVSVSNCQFMGTDVGLRFKSRRGRGGVVENIYISDISMFDIATEPLLFNLFYGGKSAVESLEDGDQVPQEERLPPIDETTPAFRNIFVERITCRNARRAMYFHGLPEQNIGNIHIEDFVVHAREGAELIDSEEITLKNIQIFAESGAALKLHNVRNLTVENLITDPVAETIYQVRGSKTEKIILNRGVDQTLIGPEVEKDAVTFVTEPAKAERQ
jgi:polygalacturonase